MPTDYRDGDHEWIRELLAYPRTLEERLRFFKDTSEIRIPSSFALTSISSANSIPALCWSSLSKACLVKARSPQ